MKLIMFKGCDSFKSRFKFILIFEALVDQSQSLSKVRSSQYTAIHQTTPQ